MLNKQPSGLDAQDAFQPIPGLISCTGVTRSVGMHVQHRCIAVLYVCYATLVVRLTSEICYLSVIYNL